MSQLPFNQRLLVAVKLWLNAWTFLYLIEILQNPIERSQTRDRFRISLTQRLVCYTNQAQAYIFTPLG